jgi:hypothetical protein
MCNQKIVKNISAHPESTDLIFRTFKKIHLVTLSPLNSHQSPLLVEGWGWLLNCPYEISQNTMGLKNNFKNFPNHFISKQYMGLKALTDYFGGGSRVVSFDPFS